jgi:hypothetical protein
MCKRKYGELILQKLGKRRGHESRSTGVSSRCHEGKVTDDKLRQTESDYDKFQGRVQERYGDRKEDVKRWTDEWFKKPHGDRRHLGKNRSRGKESS